MEKDFRVLIEQIKESRAELEDTSMKDIIEASTKHKVFSYSNEFEDVLKEIVRLGGLIKSKYDSRPITRIEFEKYKGKKVNAFRNNEVGDLCERLIKDAFDDTQSSFRAIHGVLHLGGNGYPDLKLITIKGPIFLEVKATSRPDKGSARDFYYSPGAASEKKIDSDALHLLLGFITKQTKEGFLIEGFKIVDISKIKVCLKPEFNTDNIGIYSPDTIIYPELPTLKSYK